MRGLKFALAVLGTSLVLVLGIGAGGYYAVSSAFASGFGPFGDRGAFAHDEGAARPQLRGEHGSLGEEARAHRGRRHEKRRAEER